MAKPRQTKASKAEKSTEVENDSEAMEVEVKKPVGRGRKPKEVVKDDVDEEEVPSKPKRARKAKTDEPEPKEETKKVSAVSKGKKKIVPSKQDKMDVDDEESTDNKTTKDDVKKTGPKKQTVAQKDNNSADEEKEEEAPSKAKKRGVKKVIEPKKPAARGQKKIVKEKTQSGDDNDDNNDEQEEEIAPPQKAPGKRGKRVATPVEVDTEEEKPVPAKRGRKPKEVPALATVDSIETEEVIKSIPAKRGRKPPAAAQNENDDSDEVVAKPLGRRGKRTVAPVEEKNEEVTDKPISKRGKKAAIETDDKDVKIAEKPTSKRGRKPTPVAESTNENSPQEEAKSTTNEQIASELSDKTNGKSENNDVKEKEGQVEKITKESTSIESNEEKNGKPEVADNGNNQAEKEEEEEEEYKEKLKQDDEKAEEIEIEVKKPKRARKQIATKSSKTKESNENQDNDDNSTNGDEKEKSQKNKTETDLQSINFTSEKLNKKGDKYNIKICSWNVSGARAVSKKQALAYFKAEDPDILLLQETKCTREELIEAINITGYKLYTEGATKGYCGVAFYSKKEPINVTYGMENYESNNESRLITAEYDNYYVVCSYHPNAGSKLKTHDKKMEYNKVFKEYIKQLDAKKPVIICGDLNVAHKEIDLKNPGPNGNSAGFTKEERDGMSDLLAAGFVDTYRNLYPDKEGAYTFWTYMSNSRARNVGWRLDYYLTSKRIADNVCDNVIRNEVYGSDHCPIVLFINI